METEGETQTQTQTPEVAEVHTVGTETDEVPPMPTMTTSATQLDQLDGGEQRDAATGTVDPGPVDGEDNGVDAPFFLSHECGIASPCELPPEYSEVDISRDSVKGEASAARTSAVTSEPEFMIEEGSASETPDSSISTFSVKSDSPTPVPSYETSQNNQRQQMETRKENLRRLGEQVEHFVRNKLSLTPHERVQREEFSNTIKGILRETSGAECNLHIHGSFATDLALTESDIDFLASDYSPQQPLTVFENMEKGLLRYGLAKGATLPDEGEASSASSFPSHNPSPTDHRGLPNNIKEGPVFSVQSIKFTRVPVIKVTDRRTGLKGDISFAGGQHFDSMRLTKKLLKKHPQARSMLLFLKFIVGRFGIGENVQGGMTSFVLYLLTSHFFQVAFTGLGGECEEPKETPTTSSVEENSSIAAATSLGLRQAMGRSPPSEVTKEIASFLGVASKAEPTYHSRPVTPVDDSLKGESGVVESKDVDSDSEGEDRPLGELLYLFFLYYRNFNFYDHGLHFTKDGKSKVVDKPALNKERRQHLHMTSPFDETFDVTARMHSTQAFEQLCRHMYNMLALPEPQFDNLLYSLRSPHEVAHGAMHFDPNHRYHNGSVPHHHRSVHSHQHNSHSYNHQGPPGNRKYGNYNNAGAFPYQPYWQQDMPPSAWAPPHHPQPRPPIHQHQHATHHHMQSRGGPPQSSSEQSRRTATPEPREGKANASTGPSEPRNQAATTQTAPPSHFAPFPLILPMFIHGHQFQHNHNMNSSPCQSTAYPPTGGPNQPNHNARNDSHRTSPAMGPTKITRGRGRGGYSEGRVLTPGYHDPQKWPTRRNSKTAESEKQKSPPTEETTPVVTQKGKAAEKVDKEQPKEKEQKVNETAQSKPPTPAAKYVPPHARKKQEAKESGSESPVADRSVSPTRADDSKNNQ